MSSGDQHGVADDGAIGVREQRAEDDVREPSLEAAECFGGGLARGASTIEVGTSIGMMACVRDSDAVERRVQLTVSHSA